MNISTFFINQGYNSSKLKMHTKDMLAKTRDKLLLQNQENENKFTVMVTTWDPALKYLSKTLREKYQRHLA